MNEITKKVDETIVAICTSIQKDISYGEPAMMSTVGLTKALAELITARANMLL